jgi:glutaconyl-CoA/methylmalonyl-CoA decarboxylase subunit gamma
VKLKITVHGVAYEVEVEVLDAGEGFPPLPRRSPGESAAVPSGAERVVAPPSGTPSPAPAGAGAVASPIAGTVVELKCKPGDRVSQGQTVVVVEAMKMNTSIAAPTAGTVKSVPVAVGDSVREGQILIELA